jgi:type IV pilus assembly protein PilN
MIRINLLKPEKKEIEEPISGPEVEVEVEKRKAPFFILFYVFLIVAAGALFVFQRNTLTRETSLLQQRQEERRRLQNVISVLDELEAQKTEFERKIQLIKDLKQEKSDAVIVLDELSKLIPDWVWFDKINFNSRRVRMEGRALTNTLIADYIFYLEESPYFRNVNLISSIQKRDRSNVYHEFILTARYLPPEREEAPSEEATIGESK